MFLWPLKIDISKAYDRVDWSYLKAMMRSLGFDDKWVSWMSMCMETASYSVMVNGERVGLITPGRGLRRGDPLSPYLFLICAEGLTTLLKRVEARGEIHGVRVCRGAPSLSHLLFADDCFLFCRANEQEGRKLKEVLEVYEAASGQAINLAKSEIFFSRNTTEEVRDVVTSLLGVTECLGTGKYLGLPSMVGRSKKQVFGYLHDRMWKRIHHWSGKHLSKAGKEVLVKSVAQSIPTYCMSAFLIPTSLGEELKRMINSFWWGGNNSQRKGIKWLNWEKLTMRKEHGGMGFRHFYGFNLALLGKQAWHIANNADTIVGKVFKAKYFPRDDFLGARLGHNPSYVWRSIHTSQAVVRLGMRWCIGNGEKVSVWRDPWLRDGVNSWVTSHMVEGMENLRVRDLLNEEKSGWDTTMLQQIFNPEEANKIAKIPILDPEGVDEIYWWRSRSGHYSVRSAYFGAMEELFDRSHLRIQGPWMLIWRLQIPQKIKLLLWRIARGCLPSRSNLTRRHVPCENTCPMCNGDVEDERHVFFNCPQVAEIWQLVGLRTQVLLANASYNNFNEVFFHLLEVLSQTNKLNFAMMFWVIWKRRNDKLWAGESKPVDVAVHTATDLLLHWQQARNTETCAWNAAASGSSPLASNSSVTRWTKPAAGVLKCNIDAAIFEDDNKYGIGIIVRDEHGSFQCAKTMWFSGTPSPQEAETMGLLQALYFIKAKNFINVAFEMDCQSVVNGINNNVSLNNEMGGLF